MRLAPALLCLPLALGAPGCGVILGYAGPQPVQVMTDPSGAAVFVGGVQHDQPSPTTVGINPKKPERIRAVLGDMKNETSVTRKLRIGVLLCDFFFTAGIGALVDYLTGAMYAPTERVTLNLGAMPVSQSPAREGGVGVEVGASSDAAPCAVCGEPRGDESPCPHCGME